MCPAHAQRDEGSSAPPGIRTVPVLHPWYGTVRSIALYLGDPTSSLSMSPSLYGSTI